MLKFVCDQAERRLDRAGKITGLLFPCWELKFAFERGRRVANIDIYAVQILGNDICFSQSAKNRRYEHGSHFWNPIQAIPVFFIIKTAICITKRKSL
jgi:hypothetical protein